MSETAEPYAYRDEVAELLASFTADVSGNLTPAIRHAIRALGVSIAVSLGALAHPAFKAALRAPFSDTNLEQKVRANAAPFMDAALVDRVVSALASFERVERVSTFTSLLAFDSTAVPKRAAA